MRRLLAIWERRGSKWRCAAASSGRSVKPTRVGAPASSADRMTRERSLPVVRRTA